MDLDLLFAPLFQMAWWLVPLLLVIGLVKSPWCKGHLGEFAVNLAIKLRLDKRPTISSRTSRYQPRMGLPRLTM